MRLEQPEVMRVGAVMLIAPQGSAKLTLAAWAGLATVMLLEPEPDLAAEWMARLEVDLKVTDEHRQAMADRAVAAVESNTDKRRRLLDEHRRAASLNAPMRDDDITAQIEAKTTEAMTLRAHAKTLREADPKKNRKAAKVLEAKARGVDDQLLELREEERVVETWGEAKDPILWARRRGETVDVHEAETAEIARDQYGARIVHSSGEMAGLPALIYSKDIRAKRSTGIEHAYIEGYLVGFGVPAEMLYRSAIQYREAYEIAEGQAGRQGDGGGGSGPKAPQPRLVEAGQDLADMRKGLNQRQRMFLDKVCGHDMRLREAASALGTSFPTAKRALCSGLQTARISQEIEQQARMDSGTMSVGLRVQLVSQALRKVRH